MDDLVRQVDYFSTEVPDRPGAAFKILSTFVSAGIRLLACSGTQRGRRAEIDIVPADSQEFSAVAKKAGIEFEPRKSGFLIQGQGAERQCSLTGHLEKLAVAGINVSAIDAVTAGEGRFGAILWVAPEDVPKAAIALGAKIH
jgi:hypothetical protein